MKDIFRDNCSRKTPDTGKRMALYNHHKTLQNNKIEDTKKAALPSSSF